MTDRPDSDAVRARSFGAAAAHYDIYRPRYPDALVDDVVALVPGRRIVEVGAGTGIATAAFAARGMAMTCVEPDPEMAAVLSAKLAGNADVRVAVTTFQEWTPEQPYDGLISAQAWHWTDPASRWAHAARALRGGGVLALFWNIDRFVDPRVEPAFVAAYERRGIATEMIRKEPEFAPEEWTGVDAPAADHFSDPRPRRYTWTDRVPVADYVARADTTSAHLILPPDVRADLKAELTATLTGYGDVIELTMLTDLITAARR